MSEQLRSLRHERDVREHGDAVTTRPWWNAPGEESRADTISAAEFGNAYERILANPPLSPPHLRILANPRPFT